MKQCKNYNTCGFEANKTDFPTYISSKNGRTYYKNMCAPCFKIWNKEHSKIHYLKNRESVLAKQKDRVKNDPKWKSLRIKQSKRWQLLNKDYYQKHRKDHAKKNSSRFCRAKSKAKSRNLLWTLSFEDYKKITSQDCYYCSYKLCDPVELGVGLDRLDNSKGYELDNVVSCGKLCNTLRMNILTPEETKVAIAAIIAYRKAA